MNALKGKFVNVVLSIEEGRGMDFLSNQVQVVANFNGRILESDYVDPEECPLFNTELVWEAEKKDLRKIRTSNAPLKIDVGTIDLHGKKIRIGYLLLNTRSAAILSKRSPTSSTFKWHKLIGVPSEYKTSHPELFMSLTIRDHLSDYNDNQLNSSSITERIIEEENESSSEEPSEKIAPVFPVKYYEDGFIQVGDDEHITRSFQLTILIKNAINLDLLLPEVLVFTKTTEKYYLSFSMFGIVIKTKPFWKELHHSFMLNEKVVISLLSSYEVLRAFFKEHCEVLVRFYCGRDKLGMTKINVQNLFNSNEELKIYSIHEVCNFRFPSPHGIVPIGAKGRKPSIEVETMLECNELPPHLKQQQEVTVENTTQNLYGYARGDEEVASRNEISSSNMSQREEEEDEEMSRTYTSNEEVAPSAGGDRVKSAAYNSVSDRALKNRRRVELCASKSEGSIIDYEMNMYRREKQQYTYKKYVLQMTLKSIRWKIRQHKMPYGVFAKFNHPKASNYQLMALNINNKQLLLGEEVLLHDVKCNVGYISTKENIRNLISYWPTNVILQDENDVELTRNLQIYSSAFLTTDRAEIQYETEFQTPKSHDLLAKVSILLTLVEKPLCKPKFVRGNELLPTILDEKITLMELEELRRWKKDEKSKFLKDMRLIQFQQEAIFEKEYHEKKRELDEKLAKNVGKVKELKKELQIALNQIKLKRESRKRAAETETGPKIDSFNRKELLQTVFQLEQQNIVLNEKVEKQQKEKEALKRSSLTKDQTTGLLKDLKGLEEKFEEIQRSKNYFKNQWKSAVREIHEKKTEEHKQIRNQLHNQIEELSQLSLESYSLEDDSAARSIDKSKTESQGSQYVVSENEYFRDPKSFYKNVLAGYTFIHDQQ